MIPTSFCPQNLEVNTNPKPVKNTSVRRVLLVKSGKRSENGNGTYVCHSLKIKLIFDASKNLTQANASSSLSELIEVLRHTRYTSYYAYDIHASYIRQHTRNTNRP